MTSAKLPERIRYAADNKNYACIDPKCKARHDAEYVRIGLSQWQPIETAPKDGTEVLLVWHWDSGIHRGVSVVMASWYCRTHVHLSRSKDCPNEPDCQEGWDAYAGYMSHWMPLPDPPSKDEDRGD